MTATPGAPADAPEGDAEKTPPASPWVDGAERIRSTATWITKAFVAVGAALIGSTPFLYRFGDLELSARTVVAAVAGVIALFCVGIVIYSASEVARPAVAPLSDLLSAPDGTPLGVLRKQIEGTATSRMIHLHGAPSIAALLERRNDHAAAAERMATLAANATTASKPAFEELRDDNIEAVATYDELLRALSERASYALLEHRFLGARVRMLAAAGVIAVALAVWVGGLGVEIGESKKDDKAAADESAAAPNGLAELRWLEGTTGTDDGVAAPKTIKALRQALGLAKGACDKLDVAVESGKGTEPDPWRMQLGYVNKRCLPGAVIQVDSRFAALVEPKPARSIEVKGIPATTEEDNTAAAAVALSAALAALLAVLALRLWLKRAAT